MAYRVRNINPLDLKPSVGIGVAIPFDVQGVFRTVYTTQEQIKYNLINFILTDPGERVFEPTFGLGLRRKLFEQLTVSALEDIKDTIVSGIENYFVNVEVVDLSINPHPDLNTININLSYRVVNTGIEDQIIINVENG